MEYSINDFFLELTEIQSKFHKWGMCEKTIGLYYLLNNLAFSNARFLQTALQDCIASNITPELRKFEENANKAGYLADILAKNDEKSCHIRDVDLKRLLVNIPLLKADNVDAANFYLKIIKKAVSELSSNQTNNGNVVSNEFIELVSYVFIHPAFNKKARIELKQLLSNLKFKDSSLETLVKFNEKQRSNSLGQIHDNEINEYSQLSSSQENLSCLSISPNKNSEIKQNDSGTIIQKPRSYSLSSGTGELNNVLMNQKTSSFSETRLKDQRLMSNISIMKGVVSWLKSLRLHKYIWLFTNLTYDQMLDLTDDQLEAIGITKGARHKLLLNIAKLRERGSLLTELEADVMSGGDLFSALTKMKVVLCGPLQVYDDEDLPSQFVKVMGKICTQLLMLRQPPEESVSLFTNLCIKADCIEAFHIEHKRRLNLWRSQICNLMNSVHSKVFESRLKQLNYNRHPNYQNSYYRNGAGGGGKISRTNFSSNQYQYRNGQKMHSNLVTSCPKLSNSSSFNSSSSPIPNMHNGQKNSYKFLDLSLNNHQNLSPFTKKDLSDNYNQIKPFENNVFEKPQEQTSYRDSIWCYNGNLSFVNSPISDDKHSEIDSNLESLCIEMMEHALGP